jgi:hypothetical protein
MAAMEYTIQFEVESPPKRGFRYRLAMFLVALVSVLLKVKIRPYVTHNGQRIPPSSPTTRAHLEETEAVTRAQWDYLQKKHEPGKFAILQTGMTYTEDPPAAPAADPVQPQEAATRSIARFESSQVPLQKCDACHRPMSPTETRCHSNDETMVLCADCYFPHEDSRVCPICQKTVIVAKEPWYFGFEGTYHEHCFHEAQKTHCRACARKIPQHQEYTVHGETGAWCYKCYQSHQRNQRDAIANHKAALGEQARLESVIGTNNILPQEYKAALLEISQQQAQATDTATGYATGAGTLDPELTPEQWAEKTLEEAAEAATLARVGTQTANVSSRKLTLEDNQA